MKIERNSTLFGAIASILMSILAIIEMYKGNPTASGIFWIAASLWRYT